MANIDISSTRKMTASSFTVGDFRRLIAGLNDSDAVTVQSYAGDRPWESGSTTVTVHVSNSNEGQDWTGPREGSR